VLTEPDVSNDNGTLYFLRCGEDYPDTSLRRTAVRMSVTTKTILHTVLLSRSLIEILRRSTESSGTAEVLTPPLEKDAVSIGSSCTMTIAPPRDKRIDAFEDV